MLPHVGDRRAALELLTQQFEVDGHRVERVLDLVGNAGGEAAEGGHALRQLRDLLARLARGRQRPQLLADRVEDAAQVLHLGFLQVERHPELAAAQPSEAALDDVNGPQHGLGEQRGEEEGDRKRAECGEQRRADGVVELSLDEQCRDADADLAEGLALQQHRLAPLQGAGTAEDLVELLEARPLEQPDQVAATGHPLAHPRRVAVGDGPPRRRRRWPRR